jgi:hypothetical protein
MSIVKTNQPNFFGNSGEVLKSGYIYVGQPNQDPVEFDKEVTFKDSQGNQFPAAQPLRTNSEGQISYNGKVMIATVEGDYSMLILDSNKVQINGGYIPLVSPEESGGSSDLSDYREYGLLLADIKKLEVAPGQTVGNIGKLTTTDNLGARWLVISNTGGSGDDIDLIDFDNGLQGQRIKNFTEQAVTEADKQAVRDNIDVYTRTEIDDGFQPLDPDVADYSKSETRYIISDANSGLVYEIEQAITENEWESVGPTGSGANNVWSALDVVPSNAKYITCFCGVFDSAPAPTTLNVIFYVRALGSSASPNDFTRVAGVRVGEVIVADSTTIIDIPVSDAVRFEARWSADASGGANPNIVLVLRGFGV